ncbi:MAG: GLUG motif-containing protein [Pseudomonadota bacterium]
MKRAVKSQIRIWQYLLILVVAFSLGCEESNDIDNAFGGDGDTEIIEVPPENDLSIEITSPSSDGSRTGYLKKLSGTCGTAGVIVRISGDVEAFSVCDLDETWTVEIDTSALPVGDVLVEARMIDGDVIGNAASRTLSKFSTACDDESAREDTFANSNTTGVPPWEICTTTQLGNIGTTYQNDDFELHNDLDFAGGSFTPQGNTSGGFTGTFEGNEFTISEFLINNPSTSNQGLFREVTGATFQNIFFYGITIRGFENIGILAGLVEEGADVFVDNVHAVNTTLEGNDTGSDGFLGTIFGDTDAGTYNLTIQNVSTENILIESDKHDQAGIIGFINTIDGTVLIDQVQVVGGEINGRERVGGIVGGMSNDLDPVNVTISRALNSANINGSNNYIGGIVGYANATIQNVANSGTVTRTGGNNVGGLVGYFRDGSISGTSAAATRQSVTAPEIPTDSAPTLDSDGYPESCYNTGNVVGGGATRVGGVVGFLYRNFDGMTSCYNTGEVSGGSEYVGGLVGRAESATISDSFNTGDVTGDEDYVGGISGRIGNTTTNSSIQDSYSSGTVISNGAAPTYISGGVGYWEGSDGITDFWFNGDIEVLDTDDSAATSYVGGLIGNWTNSGSTCLRCSAAGNITVSLTGRVNDHIYIGGVIAYSRANVTEAYGDVEIDAPYVRRVGGAIGYQDRQTISDSFAYGSITAHSQVGGLLGYARDQNGTITDSGAQGDVEATIGGGDEAYAGGLVGRGGADTYNSYASGDVTAIDGDYVGGLEGGFTSNTNRYVQNCFATGDVDAGTGIYVGGLSGYMQTRTDNTTDNFATGNVRGGQYVGGLLGYSRRRGSNALRRNYAVGQVIRAAGGAGADDDFGPIVGQLNSNTNALESTSNFYLSTNLPMEDDGTAIASPLLTNQVALTDAQLQDSSNFTSFDFGTPVWEMPSGSLVLPGHSSIYSYPVLEWVE